MSNSSASQVTYFNCSMSCMSALTSFHVMHVIAFPQFCLKGNCQKKFVAAHIAGLCLCRQAGLLNVGCTPIQPSLIQLRQVQQAQEAHSRHPQAQIPQCLQHVTSLVTFPCYAISKQDDVFLMLIYVLHVQDGHSMIANQPFQAKACSVALISLLLCKAAEPHTDAHSCCRKWAVCMDFQPKLKHSCNNQADGSSVHSWQCPAYTHHSFIQSFSSCPPLKIIDQLHVFTRVHTQSLCVLNL